MAAMMAALRTWKDLQTKLGLMSSLRCSPASRFNQLLKPSLSLQGLQSAQKAFSNSAKETSESQEDARNKPIRFSTSRARYMQLNQTLGYGVEIDKNASKKSIYVGMFLMAVMTYIIFFLPPDEDDLDLLELEIEKEGSSEKT